MAEAALHCSSRKGSGLLMQGPTPHSAAVQTGEAAWLVASPCLAAAVAHRALPPCAGRRQPLKNGGHAAGIRQASCCMLLVGQLWDWPTASASELVAEGL